MVLRGFEPLTPGETVWFYVNDFAIDPNQRRIHPLRFLVVREATHEEYLVQPLVAAAIAQGERFSPAPYYYLVATD